MTKYPNREALRKAHDIYRDAMRDFVVRRLKMVQGTTPEEIITDVLNFDQIDDLKASIDINHFPPIIRNHICWVNTFSQLFGSQGAMDIRGITSVINDGRKFWAHPGAEDVDSESVRTHLSLVADVLGAINKPDEKDAVESIRDRLFSDEPEEHPLEAEIAAYKERLADMTKQFDAAETEKTECEKRLDAAEAEKTVIKKQLEDTEQEWVSFGERLNIVSEQLVTTKTEKSTLEKHLETTSNRLEEANAEKTKYEANLKAASNQLAALRSVNAELEGCLETTLTQLEDVKEELAACKKDLARPSRQLVADRDKRDTEDEGSSEWRRKIWKQLCDYAAQKDTPVRFHKPGSANYLNVSRSLIDLTGFNMKVWLGRDNREIAIQLYMSKQNFYILEKQRQEIEQEFCESLEWEKLPQRRDSRISLRKDIIDPTDESDWQNQHEWIVSKIEKFHEKFNAVFLPRLQEPIGWKK